jgi:SAM-dependent methyltransferase
VPLATGDWYGRADVLECGCGTGRFGETPELPRSLDVTLTDLSPGMVDEAVARARANGFDRVSGQAVDVQSLPFGDGSFDVVVANHMLYHVPDPDRGVAELARVLRPEGVALVATNGYGHMKEINEALAEVFGSHAEGLNEVFGIDTGEAPRAPARHVRQRPVVDEPQAVTMACSRASTDERVAFGGSGHGSPAAPAHPLRSPRAPARRSARLAALQRALSAQVAASCVPSTGTRSNHSATAAHRPTPPATTPHERRARFNMVLILASPAASARQSRRDLPISPAPQAETRRHGPPSSCRA